MDTLETAYLFFGAKRARALPLRDRKWVDLPGTNEVKGWSNLGLRSAACVQANQVSRETKTAIFGGISFATIAAQKSDTLDFDNGGGDDDDEEPEDTAAPQVGPVSLCPWESPEAVFAELFHLYSSAEENDLIVDLTPGSGIACLAAARATRPYYGTINNDTHGELIRETAYISVACKLLMMECFCKEQWSVIGMLGGGGPAPRHHLLQAQWLLQEANQETHTICKLGRGR